MSRILAATLRVIMPLAIALMMTGCAPGGFAATAVTSPSDTPTPGTESAVADPASLLTPADVAVVSGLSGLEVVPYAPESGAGGDVNIATADGQLVAMLVVADTEVWHEWLTDGFTVGEAVASPVGDDSFIGPNPDVSSSPYTFGFLKGDTAVAIDTFFDANGEVILSIEQLRELATIVEGRL